MTDEEPLEHIAGDSGEYIAGEYIADEGNRTADRPRGERVVDRLGDLYWRKRYGGMEAFPCLVRTILSQNTSDRISQPAYESLRDSVPDGSFAEALTELPENTIAEAIESAGLHNQKATVIKDAAKRVIDDYGGEGAFDSYLSEIDPSDAREELLDFDGVGPKTADCVLLFASGRDGVFPVDTHVHRIARRLGIAPPEVGHEAVRRALERSVPPEKCGFGHTAMIQFGREYCSARSPACLEGPDACPLFDLCDRVGVDPENGTVVDPSEDPHDRSA